ncbi:MAG: endonuclease/exonuclease/phosphatase family protein [Gemmatimonadetes bacterium]|nr:endonuclease/exonuclease/phosphatase family protein [Gemmatimonadota bacterium]
MKNIEASPVPGIRLIDYDALLVDATRVTVQDAGGQNFAVNLGVVAPGVELKRGWVWASTIIDGQPYFFASTHLEGSAPGMPELLAAQASELAGFVPTDVPVIALGDFNDKPGSLMYRAMTANGFTDGWRDLRPGVAGFTCCHLSDLTDHVADLIQRIDYVFTRGVGTARTGLQGNIGLIGEVPADRIAGSLHTIWPSDHGGLLVSLLN